MRPLIVVAVDEVVEFRLLLQEVVAGRLGGLQLQGQMHAFMAAILGRGLPGLMRSISMPSLSHHTDTLLMSADVVACSLSAALTGVGTKRCMRVAIPGPRGPCA